MKKTIFILSLLALVACSDDDESTQTGVELTVSASVMTRAVTTDFVQGHSMNLYIKTVPNPTATSVADGVSAAYNGSTWSVNPAVYLTAGQTAYVYAAWPYSDGNGSPTAIPVEVGSQTDYMYSGTAVQVTSDNPHAALTMQHALGMIAFSIGTHEYQGPGLLTSVTVSGAGLHTSGTLNVETGRISPTAQGSYTLATTMRVGTEGSPTPQFLAIPVNSTGSNLKAVFTIDGREYEVAIPAYNIEAGMKTTFSLALTQAGIIAMADKTQAVSLTAGDIPAQLQGRSQYSFTATGQTVHMPTVTGPVAVSGIINWGDGKSDTYRHPLTHTYGDDGAHTVTVETWGAARIMFDDLSQLTAIDLSQF